MSTGVAKVAVYPLLLINLAAGGLWAVSARALAFIIIEGLYRDGRRTDGRVFEVPYIVKAFDNLFVIIMVLALLVLFVALEYHYTRGAERGLLLPRFIRVLGLQILLLGLVQVALGLMVGETASMLFGSALSWLELAGGSALFALSFLRSGPEREAGP